MSMFKKMSHRVFAIVLTMLMLMTVIAPSASAAEDGDLRLEVTSVEYDEHFEDMLNITVDYENSYDCAIWVGFVNSCNLVVTTNEGTYSKLVQSATPPINIGNGSLELTLAGCKGDVQTIKLTELALAEEHGGTPGRTISDVIIYQNGKTGFTFEFSDSSDKNGTDGFFKVFTPMIIIFGVIFMTVIVITIVLFVKQAKKNKQAIATFQPFGNSNDNNFAPPAGMDNTMQQQQQMHHMAHQQAVDMQNTAHQQVVQSHIDHNNFMPPPGM